MPIPGKMCFLHITLLNEAENFDAQDTASTFLIMVYYPPLSPPYWGHNLAWDGQKASLSGYAVPLNPLRFITEVPLGEQNGCNLDESPA